MTVSKKLPAWVGTASVAALAASLAGCASTPPQEKPAKADSQKAGWLPSIFKRPLEHPPIAGDLPALPAAGSGRGGYYKDDGPGDAPPADLRNTPDPEVRHEPLSRYANRPYTVFGKTYTPMREHAPYKARGVGSWYGKKFHGQKTSSGEIYNMYKMTAAHPTLPIPSYARVTHAATGKQIVVRINDRGPFHAGRIVDLSYTAALKIGLLGSGSHELIVERILPNSGDGFASAQRTAIDNTPAPQPTALAANAEITDMMLASRAETKAVKALPEDGESSAASPAPMGSPGFYVQIGAFSRAERAAEIRDRIVAQGWTSAALDVIASGSLHKVLSGPFATRALAMAAAGGLGPQSGLRPIVIEK